jgi:hypothetical protein
MIRLKNLLNKQFLAEAEDFIEFIDPTDIEVNVSVSGKNTIVRDTLIKNNGYDRVVITEPGQFEPSDVLIIDVMLTEEAKDKPEIARLRRSGKLQPDGGIQLTGKIVVPGEHVIRIPDSGRDIEIRYPAGGHPIARIIIGAPSILEYKLGETDDRGDFHMYFDIELSVLEKPMRITVNLGKSRFPEV